MATEKTAEKTADVKVRHDEADREIEALRQINAGLKAETAQSVHRIDVQYRYSGMLRRATQSHG